ncbi:hypothetical protein [Rhizobium leguminosarum]|uniref:hypothetical protein n=1 Tax=Rhizobium leguminosarum TaxID=384 RepID=UPI0021BBBCBB|nr:hypothetical protein [Rhizobium leguminosarum]
MNEVDDEDGDPDGSGDEKADFEAGQVHPVELGGCGASSGSRAACRSGLCRGRLFGRGGFGLGKAVTCGVVDPAAFMLMETPFASVNAMRDVHPLPNVLKRVSRLRTNDSRFAQTDVITLIGSAAEAAAMVFVPTTPSEVPPSAD